MNTDQLKELVPHYLAMLIVVFAGITVLRAAVGDLGFWIEFLIVLAIAFAYRPIVLRLGIAPSSWEQR